MKLKHYRQYFVDKLTPVYDAGEAESLFYIVLEELKGWKRTHLVLNPDENLSAEELDKWERILWQLVLQNPVQYIMGKAHFYGLKFKVDPNTLIPRPETEELVEWIIKDNQQRPKVRILDIGTGSGCIAIALAKNLPNAEVHAIDVSEGALGIAKTNAEANKANITFHLLDVLTTETLPATFDIIVSNPPYVRNLEKQEIKKNVLEHEPHLALFVEDTDALLFYRKISQLAINNQRDNGLLYFEINQYLGKETVALLEQMQFSNVQLKKDLYGNDRMIKALRQDTI